MYAPVYAPAIAEAAGAAVVAANGVKKDTLVKKRLKYADTKK